MGDQSEAYFNIQLRNSEWLRWKLRIPPEFRGSIRSGTNRIGNVVRCEGEELHTNSVTSNIKDRIES